MHMSSSDGAVTEVNALGLKARVSAFHHLPMSRPWLGTSWPLESWMKVDKWVFLRALTVTVRMSSLAISGVCELNKMPRHGAPVSSCKAMKE